MSKTINTRIQNKIDTEARWNENPEFIPIAGEAIIYKVDQEHEKPRIKFGDGVTKVADLPFASSPKFTEVITDISTLPKPSSLTYTGLVQTPNWSTLLSGLADKLIIEDQVAMEVGEYTTNFTPKTGYTWPDESTETKTIQWQIKQATPVITCPTTITLSNYSNAIEVEYDCDFGAASLEIDYDDTLITIETYQKTSNGILKNFLKIKALTVIDATNETTTIINLSIKNNKNLTDTSLSVTVNLRGLNWYEISEIAESGEARTYCPVGTNVKVNLAGEINDYDFTGTYYATIVDIEDEVVEDKTINRIYFQGFKKYLTNPDTNENGLYDVCLAYAETTPFSYPLINASDYDSAWAQSSLNEKYVPYVEQILTILPEDLKAEMKTFGHNIQYISDTNEYEVPGTEYAYGDTVTEYVIGTAKIEARIHIPEYGWLTSTDYYKNGNTSLYRSAINNLSGSRWLLSTVDSDQVSVFDEDGGYTSAYINEEGKYACLYTYTGAVGGIAPIFVI